MFFRRLGAIVVRLLALSLALQACGPPPTWPVEEPGSLRCECGFEVVIGQTGDAASINPILARDPEGFWRTHMLFDSLIHLSPETSAPVPHLARAWDISEDGTTYTFHLVDRDVRWHDGEKFSVEDIEYTLKEILKPTYSGILQQRFAGLVGAEEVIAGEATTLEGFQVLDEGTVQFKLEEPNAAFLATAIYDLTFLPKHLLAGQEISDDLPYNQAPMGTGPYRLVEWKVGERLVLEWNEHYWGEMPCPMTIATQVFPDRQAIAAALEAGDIDLSLMVPPTEVARLAQVRDLYQYKQPPVAPEVLWFNLDHPVLQDARVRQAIAQAIDVQAFSEEVLHANADPANSHITPGSWAREPTATQRPAYAPDAARALLADAGYEDGFSIKLATNQGDTYRERFVEFARAELARVGIDVEVETIEGTTFNDNALQGDFEMMVGSGAPTVPDPDGLYDHFHSSGRYNYGRYSYPEVDRLLEEARRVPDLEGRRDLYHQVMALLRDALPALPLFWPPNPLIARLEFNNVTPSALHNYGDLYHWCESQR
jgi:peptide/nickel transport system substrate-binding protein